LLGWSAARLDRHDLAQRSFAAWIRLSPQHRLERAETPAAVFADYAAALVQTIGPELDRTPRLDARPSLTVPPPPPEAWPRFAPPPRSPRDQARDFVFLVGPNAALQAGRATSGLGDHLGAQLGVELEPLQRWRVGLHFHMLRWSARGEAVARPGAQLRAAWAIWPRGVHRLEVVGGVGAALSDRADVGTSAALVGGLRYHLHSAARALGGYLELTDHVAWGVPGQLFVVSVGVALRPARAASAARVDAP
jgi:hypothetical protein